MSTTTKKYGVLVCIDGSAASDAAIAWGAREAAMRHMPITLLHAVAPVVVGWPVGQLYTEMPDWQKDAAQTVIEQAYKTLTASLGESKPSEMHTKMVYSGVVPALIDASQDAWMLVVGSQGLGVLGRLLLGSVTTGLIHHAHCPVAVIRSEEIAVPDSNAPVLVGIDGSPASEAATALAFDEASRRGVGLMALHVWSDVGVFPFSGWIGASARVKGTRSWPNVSPVGKNSIPMCISSDCLSATSLPSGCLMSLNALSW